MQRLGHFGPGCVIRSNLVILGVVFKFRRVFKIRLVFVPGFGKNSGTGGFLPPVLTASLLYKHIFFVQYGLTANYI